MGNKNDRSRQDNSRRSRRASGISWRLFGALTVFVVLVLLVIWVFQVALLNRFYEKYKLDEFVETENAIYESLGNERLMIETVYVRSFEADSCIRLFKVIDGNAVEIVDSEVNNGCILHSMSGEGLSQLYSQAVKNGGA